MVTGNALKSFRLLLLPFSLFYWLLISIRNWMFDRNVLKSSSFGLPLICVGNLAVGGTGKSPMVEYLLELLKDKMNVATLSRGYKRKTRGYALANEQSTALEIGDEPMQFHLKFPAVPVAVGEERVAAIPQLLHDRPQTELIVLDDALQHRSIRAGLNILLTEYGHLYTNDFYLPAGDLRDQKSSARRADVIIVTKCPPLLLPGDAQEIRKKIKPLSHQDVFFTAFEYGSPYHISDRSITGLEEPEAILLVTGIANPAPLQQMLSGLNAELNTVRYSDHHIFSIDDLNNIRKKFAAMAGEKKIILTTEKDAVRLAKFRSEIAQMPLYIIPVKHRFLFNEGDVFNNKILDFTRNFKKMN